MLRILYFQSRHFGELYGNSITNNKFWEQFDINERLRLTDRIFYLIKFVIRSHKVTIRTLESVLVYSIIFLFYIPHTRVVALGIQRIWTRFKFSNPIKLKRSITKIFPHVVVPALNLVLRHLKVLNFEFPSCTALHLVKGS